MQINSSTWHEVYLMNLQMWCTVNTEEGGGKSVPDSCWQVTWSIICIYKAVYSSPVRTVRWDIRFQIEGTVYAALRRPQSLGPGVDYSSSSLTLSCSRLEQWFSVWTEMICSVSQRIVLSVTGHQVLCEEEQWHLVKWPSLKLTPLGLALHFYLEKGSVVSHGKQFPISVEASQSRSKCQTVNVTGQESSTRLCWPWPES